MFFTGTFFRPKTASQQPCKKQCAKRSELVSGVNWVFSGARIFMLKRPCNSGEKRSAKRHKKGRPALGEKRLAYSAASPRSGANCGVAASQSQKSAMIKTTAQRASGVKILRAKSRKKTVARRSGKNLGRSTASYGKIINLAGAQKIKLCSHSRNMPPP